MQSARALACLLGVTCLSVAGPSRADSPRLWTAEISGCMEPREDALHDAVLVELRPLLRKSGGAAARLTIRCGAEAIEIVLERAGAQRRRRVRRGQLPARERARFIALIAAELMVDALRSSLASLPSSRPATQPQSRPLAPATVPVLVSRSDARWRVALGALVGALGSPKRLQLGVALVLGQRVHPNFGWRVDLQIGQARRSSPQGEIALTSISLSPSVLVHLEHGRFGLAIGPGLRIGGLDFAGDGDNTTRSRSFRAFSLGGLGLLELALKLSSRWALFLAAEGGYILRPVEAQADGVAVWAAEGAWASGVGGIFALF